MQMQKIKEFFLYPETVLKKSCVTGWKEHFFLSFEMLGVVSNPTKASGLEDEPFLITEIRLGNYFLQKYRYLNILPKTTW